jgi:hypothetical protein
MNEGSSLPNFRFVGLSTGSQSTGTERICTELNSEATRNLPDPKKFRAWQSHSGGLKSKFHIFSYKNWILLVFKSDVGPGGEGVTRGSRGGHQGWSPGGSLMPSNLFVPTDLFGPALSSIYIL